MIARVRDVSADGEKHPMAERELAREAADDVPRRRESAHQVGAKALIESLA